MPDTKNQVTFAEPQVVWEGMVRWTTIGDYDQDTKAYRKLVHTALHRITISENGFLKFWVGWPSDMNPAYHNWHDVAEFGEVSVETVAKTALRDLFQREPNSCEHAQFQQTIAGLEAGLAEAEERTRQLEAKADRLLADVQAANDRNKKLEASVDSLCKTRDELETRLKEAHDRIAKAPVAPIEKSEEETEVKPHKQADSDKLPIRPGSDCERILFALADLKQGITTEIANKVGKEDNLTSGLLTYLQTKSLVLYHKTFRVWRIDDAGRDYLIRVGYAPKAPAKPEPKPASEVEFDAMEQDAEPASDSLAQFQIDRIVTPKARYCFLKELAEGNGPQTLTDIAARLAITREEAEEIAKDLSERGYIELIDRRVAITELGQREVSEADSGGGRKAA